MIRQLKSILNDQLGLPAWAILAAVGCLAHIVVNALLRKQVASAWGLLGPLILGIALESYEIWIQYRSVGLFAPINGPLLAILARHSIDVFIMLAGPSLIVVVGVISAKLD